MTTQPSNLPEQPFDPTALPPLPDFPQFTDERSVPSTETLLLPANDVVGGILARELLRTHGIDKVGEPASSTARSVFVDNKPGSKNVMCYQMKDGSVGVGLGSADTRDLMLATTVDNREGAIATGLQTPEAAQEIRKALIGAIVQVDLHDVIVGAKK